MLIEPAEKREGRVAVPGLDPAAESPITGDGGPREDCEGGRRDASTSKALAIARS